MKQRDVEYLRHISAKAHQLTALILLKPDSEVPKRLVASWVKLTDKILEEVIRENSKVI